MYHIHVFCSAQDSSVWLMLTYNIYIYYIFFFFEKLSLLFKKNKFLGERNTTQNIIISPNFLVLKFCGNAQFCPKFCRNCAFPPDCNTRKLG